MKHIKTAEEVLVEFERHGITVTQWAHEHDVPRHAVFAALAGKTKGKHGNAHKVAVLLGIKDGVIDTGEC